MIRSYKIDCPLNIGKEKQISMIFKEYNKISKTVNNIQWKNFYQTGKFIGSKHLDIKNIKGKLSQRYKRNVVIQITGMLDSYLSNLQNYFVQLVHNTNLSKDIQADLLFINKLNLWFFQTDYENSYIDKKTKKEVHKFISIDTIILARNIIKHLLRTTHQPKININSITLNLDVVSITNDNSKKKHNETSFDYWANLSTLFKGVKINLPLKSNSYINKRTEKFKNYIQITKIKDENKDKKNKDNLQFVLIKEVESDKEKYLKKLKSKYRKNKGVKEIGIDLGLRKLFTTSTNNVYGDNFIDYLIHYDKEITRLFKEKQKHKLSLKKSRKYKKYVKKLKSFLKNEINKYINLIIKNELPSKLILESLNFKSPKLSKRLNRILSNFGKGLIQKKLDSIEIEFGVKVEYINAIYTSQMCSKCGYVDKNNRKGQEKFSCVYCNLKKNITNKKIDITKFLLGFKVKYKTTIDGKKIKEYYYLDKKLNMNLVSMNADFNASINILGRSSSSDINTIGIYDKKSVVLRKITEVFIDSIPQNHNSLIESLGNDYYFNCFQGRRTFSS